MDRFLQQLVWFGRFGNRMHQYAYGATYARLNGCDYRLPSDWEGTRLFKHQPHTPPEQDEIRRALTPASHSSLRAAAGDAAVSNETRMAAVRHHYPRAEYFEPEHAADPYVERGHPVCHANGCFFNPALFPRMSRRHLQALCEFSDEVTSLAMYRRYADLQGLYDVANLRRDEVSDAEWNRKNVQELSVVSMESYYRAFEKFGYAADDMQWVSDDFTGKWHVGRKRRSHGGWAYPTGSEYLPGIVFEWLDDFLMLYFARTIFRPNSSFSWWAAALSPTAKVYSPVIDRRHIYGVDGLEEIDVEFVEGNHPHWQYGKPDILLGD